MAVRSPDISAGTSAATRQRNETDARLIGARDTDLNRILTQAGLTADDIAAIEAYAYGADQTTRNNAVQVAQRDQTSRNNTLTRDQQDRILNQNTADRAAVQGRSDADARAQREADAIAAVDAAYSGYDSAFFNNYAQDIINSRLPSLRDQYKEKNRSTTLNLSQRGTGQSSAAARILGRLRGAQAADEAQLAQDASDATETLRAQLDANRSAAIRQALDAAGIQQNTPVAGATISDILAARRQAGAGPSAPGLAAAPPAQSAAPGTGARVPGAAQTGGGTPTTGGGQQGGGQQGGGDSGGVLGDQDGDGKPDAIFNSDSRGGQISGVDESGNWVYAHQPGSDGYDDFAKGGGSVQIAPITIPKIQYPTMQSRSRATLQDQPVDLGQMGIQTPLQPPPGGVGDTTPLAPTMRVRRGGGGYGQGGWQQGGGQGTGPRVDNMRVAQPGAGTITAMGNGVPEAAGGTQKINSIVPQIKQTRTPDEQAALNMASLPVSLGGTLDNALWNQRANNVDFLPEALGGTGRGPI